MPSAEDTPTLREINLTISAMQATVTDFRHEVRNQFNLMVRTDVYRAEQVAVETRIAALEKLAEREAAERTAGRNQLRTALYAAVGSVVVTLFLTALSLAN